MNSKGYKGLLKLTTDLEMYVYPFKFWLTIQHRASKIPYKKQYKFND